ncbi:V-type ATPase subunit [Clostridium lacusfryxellense]|uniref:V-type ATPase subunit n=1 Tax=Clostridium lacusfryxellense TaxID=205328 RepID=UPI001C0C9B9E|nr:V-type ATPase subunit [Clostridium lacusfryxellense]MBU3110441.1 V-type ATPase subunit [Clostridium lacusfryxellense]
MGDIVKFSAVNSKVKALIGKMLSQDQYIKLLNCKDFISTVKVLKEETSYSEFLESYNLEKIHRGNLENILHMHYISTYSKFIKYFNGEYRNLMKVLFLRWEIEDLKVIIRGKYLGRSLDEIENRLIARCSLNTINYDYLLAFKNVEDVIYGLKKSIYYKNLKNLAKDASEKGLFRIETELDFLYFTSIKKELKHLSTENKEAVQSIIGMEVDLLNLGWIYRGKTFYKIRPEELFNYTIYNGYKLPKEKIRKLCYVNDMVDFHNLIEKTPYAYIYEKDDSVIIEKHEREYQKKYFKKIIRENETNISVLMSYFMIYRIEIKDIISIIEQKRYSIDLKEGIKYISLTL